MTKPESSRFLRFMKRLIDFIDGPIETPRCRASFCGEKLPESAVIAGKLYCDICEPAVYRVVKRTAPRPFGDATGGKGVN